MSELKVFDIAVVEEIREQIHLRERINDLISEYWEKHWLELAEKFKEK